MRRNETSSKGTSVLIQSTRPAVLDAVTDFVATIEKELESDETIISTHANLPTTPPPAHLGQLRANAGLRGRFMGEVPWLRDTDIARLYEVAVTKPRRWKAERRIFSVTSGDVEQYPLFQFADGQPHPAMRDILTIFTSLSEWQIAVWFFAPNAWLGNVPPMDVLHREPASVAQAARRAVEPIEV
jgi:hypothetical protein